MHWRCLQGWRLEYEWHVAVFAKYRSLRGLRKCRARGLEVVEWAFSGRIWAVISPDWFCVWSRGELEVHWGLCRSLRMCVSVHDVLAEVLERCYGRLISQMPQNVDKKTNVHQR